MGTDMGPAYAGLQGVLITVTLLALVMAGGYFAVWRRPELRFTDRQARRARARMVDCLLVALVATLLFAASLHP